MEKLDDGRRIYAWLSVYEMKPAPNDNDEKKSAGQHQELAWDSKRSITRHLQDDLCCEAANHLCRPWEFDSFGDLCPTLAT